MSKFNELVMPYIDTEDAHDMDPESAAYIGWRECKNEVLKILKQDIQNLDLSFESVDSRFLERVENL